MGTVKTFTLTLVMVSLGYGIGYMQFKDNISKNFEIKQQPVLTRESQEPGHQIKQSQQLSTAEGITKAARCKHMPQNPVLNKNTIHPKLQNEQVYPVYSTADYRREVEKSIVPKATEVMLKISENDKKELLEIIETEEEDSDWGYHYEDQISAFLAGNLNNGDINMTQLICKTHYCQLEVAFDDEKTWMALYKTMSNEPWWNSIGYRSPGAYSNTHSIILHRLDAEQFYDPEDELNLAEAP